MAWLLLGRATRWLTILALVDCALPIAERTGPLHSHSRSSVAGWGRREAAPSCLREFEGRPLRGGHRRSRGAALRLRGGVFGPWDFDRFGYFDVPRARFNVTEDICLEWSKDKEEAFRQQAPPRPQPQPAAGPSRADGAEMLTL